MNIKAIFLIIVQSYTIEQIKDIFNFHEACRIPLHLYLSCVCVPNFYQHISKFPSLPSSHTNIHYLAVNFTSIRKAASYFINDLRKKLFLKSQFKFVSLPLLVWVFCNWCRPFGNQRQKNVVR